MTAEAGAGRVDLWLHLRLPKWSRSTLQRMIREGHVLLGGKPCLCKTPVKTGDRIEVEFPAAKPSHLVPEPIPLEVLFEDEHLLVLNKAPGIVVHPGAGNSTHTLVHAILHHCHGKLSGIGGVERPGIVHRLDKETSGCLVAAKTDAAHQGLAAAFHSRRIEKTYLALVWGHPRALSGRIEKPIGRHPVHRKKMSIREGGRSAITHWKVRESLGTTTLLECQIETGRTHQIRVHLASIGHPIVGDALYGGRNMERPRLWRGLAPLGRGTSNSLSSTGPVLAGRKESIPAFGEASPPWGGELPARQMLHAWRLGFNHPIDGKFILCEAPWPEDFNRTVKAARLMKA